MKYSDVHQFLQNFVMLAVSARISLFRRVFSTFSMETADLCDAYGDLLQYVEPIFRDFGQKTKFGGKICTVKCHEDNSYVKAALAEPGDGRVIEILFYWKFKTCKFNLLNVCVFLRFW